MNTCLTDSLEMLLHLAKELQEALKTGDQAKTSELLKKIAANTVESVESIY